MQQGLLLLYLVLSFGWMGSPAEWTPWAWATTLYHEAHASACPPQGR